jgi:lysophospholipase L1-like esterase
VTGYVRFAALGDSATFGIGDPVPGGWRGWARLLADGLGTTYDVSFCNVATPGATASDVRRGQLAEALDHRPTLASLMVGVNDTLRSTWDPGQVRTELMACAGALAGVGALLMTPRYHDHARVAGVPGFLGRAWSRRIEALNEVWDEVHETYGGLRLDLSTCSAVDDRTTWSVDRLHPSELGHRRLARTWAELLLESGMDFEPPSLEQAGGIAPSRRRDLAWMVIAGAPWFGRRAWDLGPWAIREVAERARPRARGVPAGG